MHYPFWETGLSYGVLMAVIAIVHVFISHFAIGGGLYLVVTEHWARQRGRADVLGFLKRLSKLFILVSVVAGGLTGVGIWFVIGLLNPTATEVLIHHFVWGWAIEWTFFVVEIAAALFYYYGWTRLGARAHLTLGWIYFIAAWLSLFIINGIVAFMLTPGAWLQNGGFWSGFFNPTYWPSLVMRTGITVVMAGLFALVAACRHQGDERVRRGLVRYSAIWALVGLVIGAVAFFGWYEGAIVKALPAGALDSMRIPGLARLRLAQSTAVLGGLLLMLGLLWPRGVRLPAALLLLACGFVWFGSFEWYRESARKPWAITDYVYGNGLLAPGVPGAPDYAADGLLPHLAFRTDNAGKDLFLHSCASCHRLDGYLGLRPALEHTDRDLIAHMVAHTDTLLGRMPPFLGTPAEAGLIADYLAGELDLRPLDEATSLTGPALGAAVYAQRCGICHERGGVRDVSPSFADFDADMLEMSGELDDAMPAFTGSEKEGLALLEFLHQQAKEVTP